MSVHHLSASVLGLVTPAAATVVAQPATVSAYTLTAGRLWSMVAALLGLAGVVVGGLALARSAGRIGRGNGRKGAIVALVAGAASALVGALVIAAAKGGPGTGYGIVGGFVALVVGLIAVALGWLAVARSRHTARPDAAVPR
jgi:Family of unknown function (DUF6223)